MESGLLFHLHTPSFPPWPFSSSLLTPSPSPPHLLPLCANYHRCWRDLGFWAIRNQKSDRSFRSEFPDDDADGGSGNFFYDGVRRRGGRKRRRRWWNDDQDIYEGDYSSELRPGMLDEFIYSFWFFKLLGSYGWALPIIMLSLLLATGPKAFLTAMSLPFGFSVLMFAFRMLQGWTQGSFDHKPRGKKKSNTSSTGTTFIVENKEEIRWKREPKMHRRSWIDGSNNSEPLCSNGSAAFGGWEELVEEGEFEARIADGLGRRKADEMETPLEEELNRRVKGREQPFLLRLLVAFFPFLSSWVDLLQ